MKDLIGRGRYVGFEGPTCQRNHFIAHSKARDTSPHRRHRSGAFITQRRHARIHPQSVQHITEIETGSPHLNFHFAGAGCPAHQRTQFQIIENARCGDRQFNRRACRKCFFSPFAQQTRHITLATAQRHLIFTIGMQHLPGQHPQRGSIIHPIHINQAAPQRRMFQRDDAPQAPQRRLRNRQRGFFCDCMHAAGDHPQPGSRIAQARHGLHQMQHMGIVRHVHIRCAVHFRSGHINHALIGRSSQQIIIGCVCHRHDIAACSPLGLQFRRQPRAEALLLSQDQPRVSGPRHIRSRLAGQPSDLIQPVLMVGLHQALERFPAGPFKPQPFQFCHQTALRVKQAQITHQSLLAYILAPDRGIGPHIRCRHPIKPELFDGHRQINIALVRRQHGAQKLETGIQQPGMK